MGNLSDDEERLKLFLDYLHVEMNIMGILAAFCFSALALVLSSVLKADDGTLFDVWQNGWIYVLSGSGLLGLAALCFYRVRSNLAWTYGQMCHAIQPNPIDCWSVEDLLEYADGWSLWTYYHFAFTFLCAAFAEYALGIMASKLKVLSPTVTELQLTFAVVVLSLIVLAAWRYIEMRQYANETSDA